MRSITKRLGFTMSTSTVEISFPLFEAFYSDWASLCYKWFLSRLKFLVSFSHIVMIFEHLLSDIFYQFRGIIVE
jgi:hypothetical protein